MVRNIYGANKNLTYKNLKEDSVLFFLCIKGFNVIKYAGLLLWIPQREYCWDAECFEN